MPRISQEKRKQRKQQILEAATRCFARDGFHCTSMEDIVREAKLSPGAIYCYFRGKHAIVSALAEQGHQWESQMLSDLAAAPNIPEGLERLAQTMLAKLSDKKEQQRRRISIQFWAESLRDSKIRKITEHGLRQRDTLTASFARAQRAGQLSKQVDADALSRLMLALFQGLLLQQAWDPDLDLESYLETAAWLVSLAWAQKGPRGE